MAPFWPRIGAKGGKWGRNGDKWRAFGKVGDTGMEATPRDATPHPFRDGETVRASRIMRRGSWALRAVAVASVRRAVRVEVCETVRVEASLSPVRRGWRVAGCRWRARRGVLSLPVARRGA